MAGKLVTWCTTSTSAIAPEPWHTEQVSRDVTELVLSVPSAFFLALKLPPFCSMWLMAELSVWQAEHAAEFGVATVAWVRSEVALLAWMVVPSTVVGSTGYSVPERWQASQLARLGTPFSSLLGGYSTWNISPRPGRGWSRS